MAKQRQRLNVTVYTATGHQVDYTGGWCTSVDIHKDGSLRLFEGWKQRAFHPADEWTGYAVSRVADKALSDVIVAVPGLQTRQR